MHHILFKDRESLKNKLEIKYFVHLTLKDMHQTVTFFLEFESFKRYKLLKETLHSWCFFLHGAGELCPTCYTKNVIPKIGLFQIKSFITHRGGRNSRLDFQKCLTVLNRPHCQILFLTKCDKIPSFCHNFHDFQIDVTKVVWISPIWQNFAVWISR